MDEEAQILQMNQIIAAGIPVNVEAYTKIRDARIYNLKRFYMRKLAMLEELKTGSTTIQFDY